MTTPKKFGRPSKLNSSDDEQLYQLALARPELNLDALKVEFAKLVPIEVSRTTIHSHLSAMGLRRIRPKAQPPAKSTPSPASQDHSPPKNAKKYGYNELHRRHPKGGYPSDLIDEEWALVADLFEHNAGRVPLHPRRRIFEACLYLARAGCSWRMLPHDFPRWDAVYKQFRRWVDAGLWQQAHGRLRAMRRQQVGKSAQATAAIVDSQSIKTTAQGGPAGYDGNKKIKGRKRHLMTDTLGLLLAVLVLPANVQDRDGAMELMAQGMVNEPSVRHLFVDGAYQGPCAEKLSQIHKIEVEVVKRPSQHRWVDKSGAVVAEVPARGFIVQPKRWVIERTNAWNLRFRRLVVDHDRLPKVSEGWLWLVETHLLLRAFSHNQHIPIALSA